MNRIISISGEIGSGKDTLTDIIQIIQRNPHFSDKGVISFLGRVLPMRRNPHYFEHRKFADLPNKMYEVMTGVNYSELPREEKETHRSYFSGMCESLKDVMGNNIWSKRLLSQLKENSNWIISDTRFNVEFLTIQEYADESYFIRIVNNRVERDIHSDTFDNVKWHYTIENNGTLEELVAKARFLLTRIDK